MSTPILLATIPSLFVVALLERLLANRQNALYVKITLWTMSLGLLLSALTALFGSHDTNSSELLFVDRFSNTVAIFVFGMGLVISSFANRYLLLSNHSSRFFAYTNLLVASTLLLVTSNSLILFGASWLLVSYATVKLISFDLRNNSQQSSKFTRKYFLIGDFSLVFAIAIISITKNEEIDLNFADVKLFSETNSVVANILIGSLLAVACMSRSALFPLNKWLSRSIEAPTIVSALLHAGVVNGSAILFLRFHSLLTAQALTTIFFTTIGLASLILGMSAGRVRPDIKGGLAWTTTAQMGFMTIQLALGLIGPALIHMIAHGMFKSSLFLSSSSALEGDSNFKHPSTKPVSKSNYALSGIISASVVALTLWIFRPHYLESPAVVLPIFFLWSTISYSLSQWWNRDFPNKLSNIVVPSILALFGTSVAVWTSSAIENWIGIEENVSSNLSTILAFIVIGSVATVWVFGNIIPRKYPILSNFLWIKVSSLASNSDSKNHVDKDKIQRTIVLEGLDQ